MRVDPSAAPTEATIEALRRAQVQWEVRERDTRDGLRNRLNHTGDPASAGELVTRVARLAQCEGMVEILRLAVEQADMGASNADVAEAVTRAGLRGHRLGLADTDRAIADVHADGQREAIQFVLDMIRYGAES